MVNPSWYEHVDLMNGTIVILVMLLGWFIRKDFRHFNAKLDKACDGIDKKADKTEFERTKKELFYQIHEHDHQIECDVDNCKPKTTGVIIRERRNL